MLDVDFFGFHFSEIKKRLFSLKKPLFRCRQIKGSMKIAYSERNDRNVLNLILLSD